MKIESLNVVITLKNVESCCIGDLKEALTKTFDGFEEEGEHSLVRIEEVSNIHLQAHPLQPINEFMESFVAQLGQLVSAWDQKMGGSKLLARLGQPFATLRAGASWIAGFVEGRNETESKIFSSALPIELNKLMEIMPIEIMREVATKMGIPVHDGMTKDQVIEAVENFRKSEASA